MKDDPIVGEFSMAPTVPFMPVLTVVANHPHLCVGNDQPTVGHGF